MINQCVILAAGRNSRLDTGKPKSLLEIGGLSLLERHIRQFTEVECTDFCVVTGHNPKPLHIKVEELRDRYGVSLEIVHNERYDLENGFSVSVVQEWIVRKQSDGFFLTMGDHIFERDFVTDFKQGLTTNQVKKSLCLAVDVPSKMNGHIDIEDVTRVLVDSNGIIKDIGKGISSYNRFDTGLFYMKPVIFKTLGRCFEEGKYSISDMVRSLIQKNEAITFDVIGHLWNDVDNFSDLNNTSKLGF